MNKSEQAKLLEPFLLQPLPLGTLEQVSLYLNLLQKWNARINLSGIRDEGGMMVRHFGESFFLAQHLFETGSGSGAPVLPVGEVDPAIRVMDIGSGAGFPAIPIKLWSPGVQLTMIEANQKKATFLRETIRTLALADTEVFSERAEVVAAREDFTRADVVTFRAVEHFDEILKIAVTLLAPGGRIAVLIGRGQWRADTAPSKVNWDDPIRVPLAESRIVQIGWKQR